MAASATTTPRIRVVIGLFYSPPVERREASLDPPHHTSGIRLISPSRGAGDLELADAPPLRVVGGAKLEDLHGADGLLPEVGHARAVGPDAGGERRIVEGDAVL